MDEYNLLEEAGVFLSGKRERPANQAHSNLRTTPVVDARQ
jgi:hypothetical protein